MASTEDNAGGAAAAGGGDVTLPQSPTSIDVLDDFIDKLTPKPLLHTPGRRRFTDGFENPPPASSIVWTTLSEAETYGISYGIKTIVEGVVGTSVAYQMYSDRVRERIGDYDNAIQMEITRELHLERDSDVDIWSITLSTLREGITTASIAAEAAAAAGGNDADAPTVDPLDEFVDKLTPSDENVDEGSDDLDDEDDERLDMDDHPPIVWEALPNDCITTIVQGWDGYMLAKQMYHDRVKERIGSRRGSPGVRTKLCPVLPIDGDEPHPHHLTMWIDREATSSGGWIRFDDGPRVSLRDEDDLHQVADSHRDT
ncbi:hypothetical protein PG993_006181 [Apiospora rasikravindrae]|uniref:Uncharacterized protein n=1 Tax=Apiospora rasikravindrae TaxID=990691 RepID=A0ABR1T7F8_9PEZI